MLPCAASRPLCLSRFDEAPCARWRRSERRSAGWAPEQLSPAKFYPKVATATYLYLHRQQWEREIRTRYRHLHLRLVGARRCWVRAAPAPVQVDHRADHRRARRFCPARRHWKSFAHVRGGRRFTELS
jgi:hypothetical protein